MDLLANTLTEHEKNLDELIAKLEEISEHFSKLPGKEEPVGLTQGERVVLEEVPETLIYMKLKIRRPIEELKTILDSLKG